MAALCSAQTGANATLAPSLHLEIIGSNFWCPLGLFSIRVHYMFTVQHKSRDNDTFQQQLLVTHSEVCVQKRQSI